MFIAGHESTGESLLYHSMEHNLLPLVLWSSATSLSWTLLEIARHPEVQGKLRKEIYDRRRQIVLEGRSETVFTAEDLDSLPYLNAVLKVC